MTERTPAMRRINEIILHCAATRPDQDIGAAEIDEWHRSNGWSGIGYHWVIRRDGTREPGRPEPHVGAHVYGHNANSIGVCLVGGFGSCADDAPVDHYTPAQLTALRVLMGELLASYPGARVTGHNDYAAKACPGFRVALHLAEILPPRGDTLRQPAPRIEDVRTLQLALSGLGYAPGAIDGDWGPRTQGAATAFLARHRVTQIAASPMAPLFAAVQVATTAAKTA